MTISIRNNIRNERGRVLTPLLMFVYLLVINYSISHVHGTADTHSNIAWRSLQSELEQLSGRLLSDDSPAPWQSEQHHTHGCTLVAQAAASIVCQKSPTSFSDVYNPVPHYLSLSLATPTKQHIRAPPAIKA